MKIQMLAGALLALGTASLALGQVAPTVHWRTDWESARKEALATRRPVFVVFRCER